MQVLEGKGVVASARKLIGATSPLASEPGTIRGDLAIEVSFTWKHGKVEVSLNRKHRKGGWQWMQEPG